MHKVLTKNKPKGNPGTMLISIEKINPDPWIHHATLWHLITYDLFNGH